MTGEPVFRVSTAYTLSQYRDYNRTVQNVLHKRKLKDAAAFAAYVAIGIVLALLLKSLFPIPAFVALASFNLWCSLRNLDKAEMAQYQQEQLTGTLTYEFYEDRIDVETRYGRTSNPLDTVLVVFRTSRNFIIMFGNNCGIILPQEDCSLELEAFIRHLLPVREV